mgnify:CR=1 FL=1
MILIINLCKEKLHYYEFVKPVEDILKDKGIKFFTKNYRKISEADLKKSDKIIICGTSLMEWSYLNDANFPKFNWIKDFDKPILGICAGMQIIIKMFGGRIIFHREEIGFHNVKFTKEFLGVGGKISAYELHRFGVKKIRKNFIPYATSNKGIQAIKHRTKKIYGVLFHPEVRNKDIIANFCTNA